MGSTSDTHIVQKLNILNAFSFSGSFKRKNDIWGTKFPISDFEKYPKCIQKYSDWLSFFCIYKNVHSYSVTETTFQNNRTQFIHINNHGWQSHPWSVSCWSQCLTCIDCRILSLNRDALFRACLHMTYLWWSAVCFVSSQSISLLA